MRKTVEQQMLVRLKVLGILLLLFSFISILYRLTYPLFIEETKELETEIKLELEELPALNPWMVSTAFAVVGITCLFIVKKRKGKSFSVHNQDENK